MKKFNFLGNLLRREFAMSGMSGMNGLRANAVNPDSQPTVNRQSRLTSVQRHDSVNSARVAREWLNGSSRLRVDYDSLSTRYRVWQYSLGKIAAVVCMLLTIGSGNAWGAEDDTAYTLTCTQNSSNTAYASSFNVTINSKKWSAPGNQNAGSGWRVGGAKGTDVSRYITGKSTIDKPIKKITVNHNGRSNANLTINSFSVTVSKNSDFSSPIETKTVTSPSVSSAGSFDLTPTSSPWPSGCYYKFTLVYTHSKSSNYGLDLTSLVFVEGASGGGCDKTVTLSYDGDASGLHGSFVLKAGSALGSTIAEGGTTANCGTGTTSVVVVPTPDTHYHVSSVSATNKTGDISGPDGDGNYTITYTQGSNISSTVTVTFAENPKHTLTFYNNGTQVEQIQVYEGEKIGDDLPTLTSGDACDATSNVFAGWTTENVGSTPVHSIDADQIVDYWTEPTADMSINALWATTSGSPKAQFIAENETAKTASELDPISLTKNGINLYYESGNIYHNGAGTAHNFGINADNYCIISAEDLVLEKAVTTCSGSSYKIDGVSDGTLSGDKLSVTDVRTGSLYLFANTNNPLRIVTLDVYTYDNYITTCCDKVVTLSGGSPENGTVTFSPAGSVTTCSGDQNVTMIITPNSGYYLSAFSSSGISTSNSPSIATSGSTSEAAQDITLTFAQSANGTYTANATFTAKPLNNITLAEGSVTVYVDEIKYVDVTYNPTDIITKGFSTVATPSFCKIDSYDSYNKMKVTGGRAGVTISENKTETVTIKATADNTKTTSIDVTVKPLPTILFVDLIHNKVDFAIDGTGYTAATGVLSSTVTDGVVNHSKRTPTHADVVAPVGGNTCETTHLHLIGWIRSDNAAVAAYMEGTGDAPDDDDITGAGEGYFFKPDALINTETYNGKTFYAVWGKAD